MAWMKVEASVPRNQKFIAAGPTASWLWLCGLAYCQEGLTDGFIPTKALPYLGVKNALPHAAQLVRTQLWDVVEGGWQIHDYLKHNKPALEVERIKSARSTGGQFGGRPNNLQGLPSDVTQGLPSARRKVNLYENPAQIGSASAQIGSASAQIGPEVWFLKDRKHGEVFDFQATLRLLTAAYPEKGRSTGYLTEVAFHNQLTRPDDLSATPAAIFEQILAKLETQKAGDQWAKGFIPKLERWLREGLWTQVHEPAGEPRLTGGVKNYHAPWECPHVEPCNNRTTCGLRTEQGQPEKNHAIEATT